MLLAVKIAFYRVKVRNVRRDCETDISTLSAGPGQAGPSRVRPGQAEQGWAEPKPSRAGPSWAGPSQVGPSPGLAKPNWAKTGRECVPPYAKLYLFAVPHVKATVPHECY